MRKDVTKKRGWRFKTVMMVGTIIIWAVARSSIPDSENSASSRGKEPLVDILQQAGVPMNDTIVELLPSWDQLEALYGPGGPVVVGLDQCSRFRATTPRHERVFAPAGLWNSGTNALAQYLHRNCWLTTRAAQEQVPWGKHLPATVRDWANQSAVVSTLDHIDRNAVLPVVIVRDPYAWFQSMCRQPYELQWSHPPHQCPNLLLPVFVNFENAGRWDWESLAHLWSQWHQMYYYNFPRLMVRLEDLLYQPQPLIRRVCECVGGTMADKFQYTVVNSRSHITNLGTTTSMLDAMIRYGTDRNRFLNLTPQDLIVAKSTLDADLMKAFQYRHS